MAMVVVAAQLVTWSGHLEKALRWEVDEEDGPGATRRRRGGEIGSIMIARRSA